MRRVESYLLTTLDGGARIITEPLPSVRSAAIGIWIGAGSRDEDDAHAGLSHFLEHLLFKGTQSYSALEIAEIFDAMGGELNASTARDYTVVYARVLDEHLETALDVMTDMVFAPALADLETEREVVLEEIAMIEDTPPELVHDLFTQAVFGDHPLGRPVLGSADVISSVTRRSIGAYHRARYGLDHNVVVAAAGCGRPRPARRSRPGDGGTAPGAPAAGPCRGRPSWPAAAVAALRPQGHGAVPPVPRRARDRPLGPAALHGSRSWTGSSGGPPRRGSSRRSARSGASRTPSTPSRPSTRTRARSGVYVGTREDNLGELPRHGRAELAAVRRRGTCARTRSNGRRRTSRGGSCSRWS